MRADQLLLTIHILAVAAWVGAALALQLLNARIGTDTAPAVIDRFAVDAEAAGRLIFGPAAAAVFLTGVGLVVRHDLSWTEPWIAAGLAILVITGATAGAYLIPEARRLAALAGEPGHDVEAVRVRSRRRMLFARFDLLLLVIGVAVMVSRPGG